MLARIQHRNEPIETHTGLFVLYSLTWYMQRV